MRIESSNPMLEAIALLAVAAIVTVGLAVLAIATARGAKVGDTIEIHAIMRDSSGVAVIPDSARGFVFRNGTAIDSTAALGDTVMTRYGPVLSWVWTVPTNAPDSTSYTFLVRAGADEMVDWLRCYPAYVEISNPWLQAATTISDVFTASQGGVITYQGSPVVGAWVYISSAETLTTPSIIGFGLTTTGGHYSINIPDTPAQPDTVWVSAWYNHAWVKSPTQVILP